MEVTQENAKEILKDLIKKYAEYRESKEHAEKEGYKWQFLEKHSSVFDDLNGLGDKIDSLGSQNFFPYVSKTSIYRFLSRSHEPEFKQALEILFNENLDLNNRITGFIEKINPLMLEDPEWKSKGFKIDVDSASFFLFLKNAKKYLLFTIIKPFNKFAKLFFLEEYKEDLIDSSKKISRYLAWQDYCRVELIPQLSEALGREADMLDAQDAIYCISEYFTENLEIPKKSSAKVHNLISPEEELARIKHLREQGIRF